MKNRTIWIFLSATLSILFTFQLIALAFNWNSNLKHINTNKEQNEVNKMCTINEPILFTKKITEDNQANRPVVSIEEVVSFPTFEETTSNEIDNWQIVNNPHSNLVVLNKKRKLPDGFVPEQLVVPNIRFTSPDFEEKKQLKAVAALALEELFSEAEKDGHLLYGISGYRSFKRQVAVHQQHILSKGEKRAKEVSAYPGSSEHQTGLAMDISVPSQNFELTKAFGATKEGIWLSNNAHKFGFIIRYPEGKIHVTGYDYEPWHIRYVGIPYAEYLYVNALTLEEVSK